MQVGSEQPYHPDAEIGRVISASSDESGVPDVGVLIRISERDFIWCGEITKREADDAAVTDGGWHIVHHHGADRTNVAQVSDEYAGLALIEAIAAALTPYADGPAPSIGDLEMANYRQQTCACTAAQRYVASCPKHGTPKDPHPCK